MNVDIQIGIVDAHRRAFALFLHEVVRNSVLGAVSHELGMVEVFRVDHGVDGEGLVYGHIVLPRDLFYFLIYGIGTTGFEMIDWFQDAQSGAATEIRLVEDFLVSRERHHSPTDLYVVSTYRQ